METSSTCIKLVIHCAAFNPHQVSNLFEKSRNASAPDQGIYSSPHLVHAAHLDNKCLVHCGAGRYISFWPQSLHFDSCSFSLLISAFGNSELSHEKSIAEAKQFRKTLFVCLFVPSPLTLMQGINWPKTQWKVTPWPWLLLRSFTKFCPLLLKVKAVAFWKMLCLGFWLGSQHLGCFWCEIFRPSPRSPGERTGLVKEIAVPWEREWVVALVEKISAQFAKL